MAATEVSSVAVIPARGGSKRIPRKNVRAFAGRPLISWTIDTCLASGLFADVIVTTDDDEIAAVARAGGASVPFTRPASLADDHATTAAVMAHAVASLAPPLSDADLVCCVYPAAVLVSANDLALGRQQLLDAPEALYAGAVVRYSHPIQRALERGADGRITLLQPELASTRTQDLPTRWHDAGQFYWGRATAWREQAPYFSSALGVELPSWRAQDIDDEDDWIRAEAMFRSRAPEQTDRQPGLG